MTDFLLELRSEEIPARMQAKARADLERLFASEIEKTGLKAAGYTSYATPRRLTLIARDLPLATQAVSEELKGPPEGAPDAAVEGFCRKAGVTRDQLEVRDVKGRATYFAVIDTPGRETKAVLAEAIPAIVRAFPWPKSMRWGDASRSTESLRWVRPLHGIVALLGDEVVPCEVAGVTSGSVTLGHRFHHPGEITIGSADDYVEKLRACHVIVDQDERRNTIALGAKMAAQGAGLSLVEDQGLLEENAGLTEWPMPLLGRFDEAFLDVPPEVIQLTARVNQKYFVCHSSPPAGRGTGDAGGGDAPQTQRLANAFICVANIDAEDGGEKIVAGNEKVLAARLSDARFFYETDLKTSLEDLLPRLEKIVFHEKLGTVADKVDRVAKLARWLVEQGIILPGTGRGTSEAGGGGAPQTTPSADSSTPVAPAQAGAHVSRDQATPPSQAEMDSRLRGNDEERAKLADMAERAARLAKADLVTGMVGEFPELQGLMGGYYAAAQGEPAEVAEAIRDHYKPVGQGDDVPTAPVTVAVSLADKLDTLFSFFDIEMFPTGSKDPFALRRAALGFLQISQANGLKLELSSTSRAWGSGGILGLVLADFMFERLGAQLRDEGVRYDYIQASRRWQDGNDTDGRVDRVEARARALTYFLKTEDGKNLLAGYKRAANILKKEDYPVAPAKAGAAGDSNDPAAAMPTQKTLSYTPEPAEADLIAALDTAEPQAASAIGCEDFEGAMAALASLRAPIDAFFDTVTVNDSDADKRASRLALLARMRDAVHKVADFSRIEG